MPKANLAKHQEWEAHLKAWRLSGLSEAQWCRNTGQKHHTFYYWKKRLGKQVHTFCELKESLPLNIELRVGQVIIQFPSTLEFHLIKQYLKAIVELAC
jgi:hypothetical protein